MHGRGSPLAPSRCISVALGFEPRESVSNLETGVKFPVLNRIESKVWGLDLGPTSGLCQCTWQDVTSNAN